MTTLDDPAVILGTAGEYDEDWEFDAPRYHDFQDGTPAGQSADRWFETSATKGLASPDASKPASKETSSVSMKPSSQQNASQSDAENKMPSQAAQKKASSKPAAGEAEQVRAVLAHITNNTASARKTTTAGAKSAGPKKGTPKIAPKSASKATPRASGTATKSKAVSPAMAAPKGPSPAAKPKPATAPASKPLPAKDAATKPAASSRLAAPPAAARKAAPSANVAPSARPITRSATKPTTSRASARAAPSVRPPSTKVPAPSRSRPHITVPKSPFLRVKHRSATHRHEQTKTSEELEMEKIEMEKRKEAALRRLNSRTVGPALQGRAAAASRATKRPPTQPAKEPSLRTAKRQRVHTMETRSAAPEASPWKSTAQRVAEFTAGVAPKKTTTRAASSTASGRARGATAQQRGRSHLTVPHTPRFATTRRARASRFKPTEELEVERAAAEAKALKAQQAKHKVLKPAAPVPVRRNERKPATEFQPFNFATDRRAAQRPKAAATGPPPFVFGAEGPVTRSRARVPSSGHPVQRKSVAEEKPAPSRKRAASRGSTRSGGSSIVSQQPVVQRHTTAGSMLLGGAVRVMRRNQEEEMDEHAQYGGGAGEELDGMQAIIRAGAGGAGPTTLHNPLYNDSP